MTQISINRKNRTRDIANIVFFVASVICGTLLINAFVFRSYSIVGRSMENTFYQNDRVIVNRLPVTWAQIKNTPYVPKRGDIIVFENPQNASRQQDRYLIKRVVGLPGDTVNLKNNKLTITNKEHPEGFNPNDELKDEMSTLVSGEVDNVKVQDNHLFVIGDHREGSHSYDSRNGLGQVPFHLVIGPVNMRLFPLTHFRFF